jgi:hypothetical protein
MTMPQSRPEVLQTQIIAVALLASPLIHAIILGLLTATGALPAEGLSPELGIPRDMGMIAVLLLAAAPVMAGFMLRRFMLAQLSPESGLPGRTRIVIVSLALAEAGGVIGLLYGLLTGHLAGGFLAIGVAFVGGLLFFPSRAWLEGA